MMIVIFVSKSGCVIFWATQGQKAKTIMKKSFIKTVKIVLSIKEKSALSPGIACNCTNATVSNANVILNIASFSVFLCILSLHFETNNCFFIFQNVFSYKMIKIVRIFAICQWQLSNLRHVFCVNWLQQ